MKLVFISILLSLTVAGCKQTSSITTRSTNQNKIRVEQLTDTIRVLERDTSTIKALLECDSLGKVRITQLNSQQNDITNLKTKLKNNLLDIEIETKTIERYKEVLRIDTIYIEQETIEKIEKIQLLRWWERILMWIGAASTICYIPKIFRLVRKIVLPLL